ncbi:MAG: acetyl-CoA decarbonylase/synthase complex subunit delta [Dehalococcoidia bacterium]|nr:acetyl-CoA decarbonylase/synthase complex subunit delta [Dehalococcoidia bacterium]
MPVEIPAEKWTGKIREVTLGGGGRKTVIVGGETALPFLHFEGSIPNRPVVAVQILDCRPDGWSEPLLKAWGDVVNDPAAWAKKAVELGADVIFCTLASAHPENQNSGAAEAQATAKKLLSAVDVPLIFYGPEVVEKDNEVLVAVSDAASGMGLGLGICEDKNYRTIVASCLANGHVAIGRAPIEINMQKQLNILMSDMGIQPDRIIMDPTTGALGYGLEYTYSVMERLRLAALGGDSMTSMPMLCTVGHEAWRQKEAKAVDGVPEAWGSLEERGILWEQLTASTLLVGGADIVVLRHPKSVDLVKDSISKLMGS